MPELPEVEVLVRYLAPALRQQTIRAVIVRRAKVIVPTSLRRFKHTLVGARFESLTRRGKYLLFALRTAAGQPAMLLGHLGMTGRMYLTPRGRPWAKHAAVVLSLGRSQFVYEDTRYFGRLTLDTRPLDRLGPEPLGSRFTAAMLRAGLAGSNQPVKVRLLDQSLVAGVGNIYASEALHRARISPVLPARHLTLAQAKRLRSALRRVLAEAIRLGRTVPLNWAGTNATDAHFYYGRASEAADYSAEKLRVYDRAGKPCRRCGTGIHRLVQAGRSTFYCPACQGAATDAERD